MNDIKSEKHPLEPFLPENAKVLMLGSFPPKRERWSMDFFYPNLQNDMWRIFGLIFFGNKDHFLTDNKKAFCAERIRMFLAEKGVALGDTAKEVIRHKDNASDKFLEVVESVDLEHMLRQLPDCRAVITTGQKATDTLLSVVGAEQPKVGSFSEFCFGEKVMKLYRMPSSSRAYPKPLEEKASVYKAMFADIGIL
ncbi:MAG: uracil-DNA glycosylase family protein [Bacteroidales bacterium]|nr:uracil-DNA glycosylase family protein [Bacteroidales bacterium]